MKRRIIIIASIGILLLACSCSSPAPKTGSDEEAQAIYTEIMESYEGHYLALEKTSISIKELLQSDLDPEQHEVFESLYDALHYKMKELRVWESGVVPVPGMPHIHVSAPHSHDHTREEIAARMSDDEMLELQREYREELIGITSEINHLIEKSKNYQQSAK